MIQLSIFFSVELFGFMATLDTQIYIDKMGQKLVDKQAGVEVMFGLVDEVSDVPTEPFINGFQWFGNYGANTALALYYTVDKREKTFIQAIPISKQNEIIRVPFHLTVNDEPHDYMVVIEFKHKRDLLHGVDNIYITGKMVVE